jgi:DtxR family Mn-dependent transcriptional regulator
MIFRKPTEDPHGDPIPNAKDKFWKSKASNFWTCWESKGICGVKDTSSEFLKYLDKQEIALGSEIEIIERGFL